MAVLLDLPLILCLLYVFVGGTVVGSFLNVLIARLPYEKSIIWPGSRCFHCLQPIRLRDNLPIVGYLLLRGRCRACGTRFSARYLWVELGTAVALTGLFVLEVLLNWLHIPGLNDALPTIRARMLPPLPAIGFFLFHGCLLSLLIAAAVIDAGHRIIPPQISYTGTVIGLVGATVFAWPWPSNTTALAAIPANVPWYLPQAAEHVPVGATLWPFAGPPPDWAPAGSWQLGLLNGLIGAAAGMAIVRLFKFLFEFGFGQEALGLGDADLLMMAGAFLGWQVAVIGFFIGAFAAILMKIPELIWQAVRGNAGQSELPFGPGLAVGIVLTWLGWPLLTEWTRLLFDPLVVGMSGGIICVGLLVAGVLLRRPAE
jgi:leader peptidase (prepilin peptidase)/N-methyltransferase